jgi:hypothetical protein
MRRALNQLKIAVSIAILLLIPWLGRAQFLDDFSDGDLTNGVIWVGDLDKFGVETGRLQLQAIEAGSAALSTSYIFQDSLRFGIEVYLLFPPSSDNQLRIFLYHEDADILLGEAFFLTLGESGANDAFMLVQRDQLGNETELKRFASIPHGSILSVGLQVEYIQNRQWIFYFDHDANGTYDDVEEVDFNFSPDPNGYFGLGCQYTSSRVDKFYFDNAYIEPIEPDQMGPQLVRATVISTDKVLLSFDEAVDGSALNTTQFILSPGNFMPTSVDWNIVNAQEICLNFSPPLVNQTNYSLETRNIGDTHGNLTPTQMINFIVFVPEIITKGDVIINEIHAAPSDETLMPNSEFIELFNRSDKIIDIGDLTFQDASSMANLPNYILFPSEFVVLADAQDVHLFDGIDTTLGVTNFPSLNNGGDQLALLLGAEIIDEVLYRDFWYGNSDKSSGWSLECKNPESLCRGFLNWTASNNASGGTPAEVNSVFTHQEPEGQAIIRRVQVISETEVSFVFNIEMNQAQLEDQNNFLISPQIDIFSAELEVLNGEYILNLYFADDMVLGQIYTITFNTDVCACNGSKWPDPYSFSFGLSQLPEFGDVRISEILFSPFSGESEFIEMVNTSQKIISSNDLWLHYQNANGSIIQARISADFLLFPGEFHVITPVSVSVLNNYTVPFPQRLHDFSIPALTNSGGQLTLFIFDENRDSVFVDRGVYSEDFHDPLLDESNGVSLERLLLNGDGEDPGNWYTASTLTGGATPTGENSQNIVRPETQGVHFELSSATFSPDGDGFEDVMTLFYEFDQPGFIAQAKIFSYDGVLIKDLINNEALGTTGQLHWRGETDEGARARVGIYYVLIKAFRTGGETIMEKKKIVLARML